MTFFVGTTRFELATSCTPCKRATGLRYVPFYRYFPFDGDAKVVNYFIFQNIKYTFFIKYSLFTKLPRKPGYGQHKILLQHIHGTISKYVIGPTIINAFVLMQ